MFEFLPPEVLGVGVGALALSVLGALADDDTLDAMTQAETR